MVGFKLFDFTHELLELSLRTRAARHEVLSANIANADTPGYRPKDLDFNAVMKSAVEAGSNGSAQEGNLTARASADIESAIYEPEYPNNRQGEDRLDGNAVSLDSQMALLTENSLGYEASLAFLQRTLAGLLFAIREGRG
jgi:flagellar basal-body rod protein FlgB